MSVVLQGARMRLGLELQDVSSALRIRVIHLQAIEDGRFDDLPGPTYALGFVRAYADYLGLDRDEVVERFRTEAAGLNTRTELHFPTPVPESRVPSGAILLISVLLAALAYGGWYYLTMGTRSGGDLIAEVPRQFSGLLGRDGEGGAGRLTGPAESQTEAGGGAPSALDTALSRAGKGSAEPAGAAPASGASTGVSGLAAGVDGAPESQPAGDEGAGKAGVGGEKTGSSASPEAVGSGANGSAVTAHVASPVAETNMASTPSPTKSVAQEGGASNTAPTRTAAENRPPALPKAVAEPTIAALPAVPAVSEPAEAAAAVPAQVFGTANTNARIIIRARDDSWVQVRDSNGDLVLTRMLRAGDSYRVPNRAGLTLLTGNAGALEILVDGHPAPPIGPGGSVRRDVALDAARLMAGTAVGNN